MGIRILIPKPQRKRGGAPTRRFVWVAAGFGIWGVAYTVFGAGGMVGVYRARADVQGLQEEIVEAEQANQALRESIRSLRSEPMTIEREARERLGLVKPGEKVYLLPPQPPDNEADTNQDNLPATQSTASPGLPQ
ncbi:MAG TPA: septum formation initiator family protein [Acidobacteriota bacterium]|nr:septum formation initiator family protein [Acidobacteriota bacterium]